MNGPGFNWLHCVLQDLDCANTPYSKLPPPLVRHGGHTSAWTNNINSGRSSPIKEMPGRHQAH